MKASAIVNRYAKRIASPLLMGLVGLIIAFSCANPISPSGGPRDIDPPVILRAEPENNSVNFDATHITLWFDEFIQLRSLRQQFISSPPFTTNPDVQVRGKTLRISFEEELKPNTTYTLFFGDAIADFTEANPLSNFSYVFSTGPVLDSMQISGKVLNAFTLKPEEGVLVMLYDIYTDSIPMLERPYYISRTDKAGLFRFTNLRNIPYKIFALRDVNANMIYDLPNEEIAFIDSLIYPTLMPAFDRTLKLAVNDTIAEDEAEAKDLKDFDDYIAGLFEDVIDPSVDSLFQKEPESRLVLFLFNEVDSVQRIERTEYIHPNRIRFAFRFPVKELDIQAVPPIDHDWNITEISKNADTVVMWLRDVTRDTLRLRISEARMKTDTIRVSLTRLQSYLQEKKTDTTRNWLEVSSNITRVAFEINKPVEMTFSEPLRSFDPEKIILLEDSVAVIPTIGFKDEVQRMVLIEHPWQDTTFYDLFIPDSSFFGIYGHTNDTLKYRFKTRMHSEYGSFTLNLQHAFQEGQLIAELMDARGNVIRRKMAALDAGQVSFDFLNPGTYSVKIIHDANSNGKWDTGVYLSSIQPERVYLFDTEIQLRANWDVEETFVITNVASINQ